MFASVLMAIAMTFRGPSFAACLAFPEDTPDCRTTRIVLLLAVLAFVMFLVEGAILDWSALARHRKGARKRGARRTPAFDVRNRNDGWTA